MPLASFAGVFSRYFVVGFFVPAFVGLASASLLLSHSALPDALSDYSPGTQLVILGGLAIPVGVVLQGFHAALLRGFAQHRSGADLSRLLPTRLYSLLLKPERCAFTKLEHLRDDKDAPLTPHLYRWVARLLRPLGLAGKEPDPGQLEPLRAKTRTTAATKLDERYPTALAEVLPTRIGNVLQASQQYAFSRWGLDTWAVWPRIEGLLSDQERDLIADSRTELAFFLNSAFIVGVVGALLIADEIWHKPLPAYLGAFYLIPFLLGYLLYRLSVGSAIRLGAYQRAGVDLHHLELYEKLGLELPKTSAGRYQLARTLNRFLLYGIKPAQGKARDDTDA